MHLRLNLKLRPDDDDEFEHRPPAYLVSSAGWPKGATAVGAGCKIAVQPKKIDVP
jgi:hypothetical protein